jgi:hypothetical protein
MIELLSSNQSDLEICFELIVLCFFEYRTIEEQYGGCTNATKDRLFGMKAFRNS